MEGLKKWWNLVGHSCVVLPCYLSSLWVTGFPKQQETQLSGRADTRIYQEPSSRVSSKRKKKITQLVQEDLNFIVLKDR